MRPDLPNGYRLVSNTIRRARITHRLDCGCIVQPGWNYHRVSLAYEGRPCAKSQIVYLKRHVFRCPLVSLQSALPTSVLH